MTSQISIHAPLAGRDVKMPWSSTPSILFQSTRPLRGATDLHPAFLNSTEISIHAPLAGRDSKSVQIALHIFAITDKF